ncbi:MAG: carboxypeptidase regulatory-like domain-containing protein [Longimicrobiales bacterium]|nr:carboxypeptidase regulatory-like domain-containing protein [Longimicrobiales bacterium]
MPSTMSRMWWALGLCAVLLVLTDPSMAAGQEGSIEGTVTLEPPPPPRRTANRYPGGAAPADIEQKVPAIVYVVGRVSGSDPAPRRREMVQQDTAFAPAALVIPVGSTVAFPNADPFFHNVFSYSGSQRFDLGRYPQGESKSVTFDEPGVVGVFCEVHEKMRGVIVVTENPYHAFVDDDGSFRIEGLPPGEYRLAFWSADHDSAERTVTVSGGGTSTVEVELRR